MIFKPEGAYKEMFASCIIVRSVVDFRLIMVAISLRTDSGNVPHTCYISLVPVTFTTNSGMALEDNDTNEQSLDGNGHPS